MGASLARASTAIVLLVALSACRQAEAPSPPHAPQTKGTLQVRGLQAPVTVVRDEWGIPHITASGTDDLFFAQGFVQAQDRLFQMDLWKRSAQGRLSEVMGANFIQRDSMTRRIQFRGDLEREWASYGPDVQRIAVAFTNGINAWVRIARQDLPEEFSVAGWTPEFWKPEDLLNRTDAFLASSGGLDELFRARLVAAVGAQRANDLFPLPDRQHAVADPAVDLRAITFVIPDALRRIGTQPFFLTLAGKASEAPRPGKAAGVAPPRPQASADRPGQTTTTGDVQLKSDAGAGTGSGLRSTVRMPALRHKGRLWLVDSVSSETGAPLIGVSWNSAFTTPSARYFVHLSAPGWNVIGATSPWLPGVSVGHNDKVAWAMTPVPVDTQDIFVERVNPQDPHQVEQDGRWVDMAVDYDRLDVKGRDKPVQYERQYTANGVVIAQDRERNLVYTLRWTGTEPGGAGELSALAFNRVSSAEEFSGALSHWKAPVAEFVFADSQGSSGRRSAGLVPVRAAGAGWLPSHGWSSARRWRDLVEQSSMEASILASGPGNAAALRTVQSDVTSPGARTLLALIDQIRSYPRELETLRLELLAWDGRFDGKYSQADTYRSLEAALRRLLAMRASVPDDLLDDVSERLDVVALMTRPSRSWFSEPATVGREATLVNALSMVASERQQVRPPGQDRDRTTASLTFEHPLGVFEVARRRFNVGPFPLTGHLDTMLATDGRTGSVFRAVFDAGDWNRSGAVNSPGQSGSPASPHFDDLATRWSAGEYIPLVFDQSEASSAKSERLVLQPG